jgi:hypothetical protein
LYGSATFCCFICPSDDKQLQLQELFIIFAVEVNKFLKTYTMKNLFLCYQRPYLREIEVMIESGFVGSMENPTGTEDIEW